MPDLTCPTCKTELMSHEAAFCLDKWTYESLGFTYSPAHLQLPDWARPSEWVSYSVKAETWVDSKGKNWFLCLSTDAGIAYRLWEQEGWEMDPWAKIARETIDLSTTAIYGPTFPLRVCRAVLVLASRRENV